MRQNKNVRPTVKVKEFAPLDEKERRKRKRERILIVVLTLFLVALTIAEVRLTKSSSSLPFVNSIFFFGLLNVNLIFLIALIWLIFRNVGKLFLERRRQVMGSRLKTKLVLALTSFAIVPTIVLFTISALYINSSFDKWFSLKVQNTLQASLEITRTYYRNADRTAQHFGEHLASQIARKFSKSKTTLFNPFPPGLKTYLNEQRQLLALDAIEYYPGLFEERFIAARKPSSELPIYHYPRLPLEILKKSYDGKKIPYIQHLGKGDLIRSILPVQQSNKVYSVIVVNTYIPVSLVNKVDTIANVFDDYQETNPLKYPIKTIYFVILILITLVIIFVAIWIGLYLAKELTDPVEKLVTGAQEIGSGNLNVQIEGGGFDELGVLIQSFNKMANDLKQGRKHLTTASKDLEKRKLQLEAVLANIGAGVLVVEKSGKITTFNRAASQLLEIPPTAALEKNYRSVLHPIAEPLIEVIERSLSIEFNQNKNIPAEVTQWNIHHKDKTKSLAGIATQLKDDQQTWGVVVVIDDMTYLIKGQREMAWREVARRIAHEIKNPLTPIKLSAQRLQRRFRGLRGKDHIILSECTDTIVKHTDELKEMVNEFSNFARLPATSLAPYQLNKVIQEVIQLYTHSHPNITFEINLEKKLPIFEFDKDQIKRVLMNIVDNAISALQSQKNLPHMKIKIETHFNKQLQMAVTVVKDNGPGMRDNIKSRVFEPYFSTKKEGTGLGLAIAKRIINDHDGFIRVQSEPAGGTEFLIELPTSPKKIQSKKEQSLFNDPDDNEILDDLENVEKTNA